MDDYDKILGTINGIKEPREQIGQSMQSAQPDRTAVNLPETPTIGDFDPRLDTAEINLLKFLKGRVKNEPNIAFGGQSTYNDKTKTITLKQDWREPFIELVIGKYRKDSTDPALAGDPAEVLAHEMGHHFQYEQMFKWEKSTQREKLDKHLTKHEADQYDFREINRMSEIYSKEQVQKEADALGSGLLHLKNNTKSQIGYINAYMELIRNDLLQEGNE